MAAFGVAVLVQLWSIQRDLNEARATVRDLELASIDEAGGLSQAIRPARDAIAAAEAGAESPLLDALGPIPVVNDQVEGLRSVVDRVERLVATGDAEVRRIEALLDDGGDAETRIELVATAIDSVTRLRTAIDDVEPIDRRGLLGPVRSGVDDFEDQLREADADLATLAERLTTAEELLVGPTRLLVVAANNSEHRAGMGMHLSAGVVTIEDGSFETSPFIPTGDLTDLTARRVEVPAELDAVFNPIWDFGREWRTASTTPNFPVVGSILDRLAEQTPIGEVDAVLSLDVPALASLLVATGPVELEGTTIDAGNVTDLLLRDTYRYLGAKEQDDVRRSLQSRIARSIFDAITSRDIDVVTLARGLLDAADGRHLLGWSEDDDVQALWESLGATGELSSTSFLVSFQNATASKRDYYLDPTVDLTPLGVREDGSRRFRIEATLENPVVEPSTEYIDSLNPLVPVGVHRAYVTFTLPDGTTDIEARSGDLSRIGSDGPTELAAVWIRVPESESRSATIDVTFPAGLDHVELVPSARVRPQRYEFGPSVVTDDARRTVRLPYVDERRPQDPDPVAAASLVTLFASLVLFVQGSRRRTGPEPDPDAAAADARVARALALLAAMMFVVATLG